MAKRRGNGEGSIWKEGKSWRTGVTVNSRRVTKSFKTQSECQSWLQQMKTQVNQGLTYRATQISLGEYLKDWLNVHKSSLKPRIGERYEQIARDYILPFIGKYKL
jgi:hypothetical protein